LLPLLAQMAVGRVNDPVLKVFGNDYPTRDGTCVRDYIHVLDLAAGHLLALEALSERSFQKTFGNVREPNVNYKAYNLGKGRGQSVFEIVNAMTKASGYHFETDIVGRRVGDVPDLTGDPTLAEEELGFSAPRNLETMCRDLWNWQTKNPLGYDTPLPSERETPVQHLDEELVNGEEKEPGVFVLDQLSDVESFAKVTASKADANSQRVPVLAT